MLKRKIEYASIIVLIFFCLLNFIGCGEKKEKTVEPLVSDQKANIDNGARTKGKAEALKKKNLEKIAEPYIKSLKDKNVKIRKYAALALGEIKYENAVDPLIETLKDENSGVRWAAARALGEIKSVKATGPLIQLLKDESDSVREEADKALRKIRKLKQPPSEFQFQKFKKE